ncbi:hypothetical protein MBLNU457_4532t1 [Dothideomycetes sp. NU457]
MATPDTLPSRSPLPRKISGLAASERGPGTPGSPRTPTFGRSISSQYGSPGSYRPEEDSVIYEVDARSIRAGLPGESVPRCIVQFGPDYARRAGDYSRLISDERDLSMSRDGALVEDWQLWDLDVRNCDLGLVEDKVERLLREIHIKHMLLDIKPRKAVVVMPTSLPHPLTEVVLRTLFNGPAQASSALMLNGPILSAVAAGVRSGLVIDIGWHETTISVVYEYRETLQRRTIRSTRMVCERFQTLVEELSGEQRVPLSVAKDVLESFACCGTSSNADTSQPGAAASVRLSVSPRRTVEIPFEKILHTTADVFLDLSGPDLQPDDHQLPIHVLAWRALLASPLDVRAICMSRIMITGEGSSIPGLKSRLVSEIEAMTQRRGWDLVSNYGSATKHVTKSSKGLQWQEGAMEYDLKSGTVCVYNLEPDRPGGNTHTVSQERDEISEKLTRDATKGREPPVKAVVRGIGTLGAWAGASILSNLRIDAAVEIKKDDFFKQRLSSFGSTI